jgi:hypothetical protein
MIALDIKALHFRVVNERMAPRPRVRECGDGERLQL